MPDKYDAARFGQEVGDLQGIAGANGESFSESTLLENVFDGRTGIQAVEETLAEYHNTVVQRHRLRGFSRRMINSKASLV